MADLLRIKRRPAGGAAGAPTSLLASEIAFNEVDDTLWYGKGNSGGLATAIIPIAGSGAFPALGDGRWVKKTGDQMSGGLSFGQRIVPDGNPLTMSGHLSLFDGWGGFSITSGTLNLISGAMLTMRFTGSAAIMGTGVGLYLDRDPGSSMEPVTLQYLQANTISTTAGDARWVNVGGDTMTGDLTIGAGVNNALTITPGATGADTITLAQSGTAGIRLPTIRVTAASAPLVVTDTAELPLIGAGGGALIRLLGSAGSNVSLTFDAFGSGGAGGTAFFTGRGAQGSASAPSAMLANGPLVMLRGQGFGATSYGTGATIAMQAAQTWTDAARGAYITFNTVGLGTNAVTERLRIDASGIVLIGQTVVSGAAVLQVTGGLSLTNGDATLFRDPTQPMHAVWRQYLDNNYSTNAQGDARWIKRATDWMDGPLGFGGMTNQIAGGGDAASSTVNNLMLSSWNGIGFYPTVTAGQIPTGNAGIYFDVRNGFGNFRRVYLIDAITDATQAVTKQYVDTNTITAAAGDARWVNVNGDTMTGALTIQGNLTVFPGSLSVSYDAVFGFNGAGYAAIYMNAGPATNRITYYQTNGSTRWLYGTGAGAESGGNAGSDFFLSAYNDTGSAIWTSLYFSRATGLGIVAGDPTAPLGIATKQYSDRNRRSSGIDMSSGTVSLTVDQADIAQLYLYGGPAGPATLTLPVATTVRQLWAANNITNQPITIRGASGGTILLPVGASRAIWTDTGGIYPLYNAGDTRAPGDNTTFWATTEFVTRGLNALNVGAYLPTAGGTMSGMLYTNSGINFNNGAVSDPLDRSRGITLFGASTGAGYGFAITPYTLNYAVQGTGSKHDFYADTTLLFRIQAGDAVTSYLPLNVSPWIRASYGGTDISLMPGAGPGAYNPLTQANDALVIPSRGAPDTGAVVLGPWSNSALGIRIDGAAHTIAMSAANGIVMNNPLNVSALYVAGDTTQHNVYNDGSVGIMYRGLGDTNWFGFKWDGTNYHAIINGWDSGPVAVQSWVTANFAASSALGNYVAKAGDVMSGQLMVNTVPTDTTAQLWLRPQDGINGGISKIRFGGNFVNNADGGARYIASIRSGMVTAWSTEYLDIWVNNGGTNDANSDANQVRSTRFTRQGVDVNGYVSATGNVYGYSLYTANGQVVIANNPAYYFERNSGTGIWRIVDNNTALFSVDGGGNATILGTSTHIGKATFQTGIYMNNNVQSVATDLSHGIDMYGGSYGFSITGGTLNVVSGGGTNFYPNGTLVAGFNDNGLNFSGNKTAVLGRDPTAAMDAVTKQYVDRTKLYLNVKSYGVVGDGRDDTTAIENAVAAAATGSGDTVFFPAGTYRVIRTINIPRNVSIMGVGTATVIVPSFAGQYTFALNSQTETGEDFHSSITDLKIAPTAADCSGIWARLSNFVTVENITFEGTPNFAVIFDRCLNYKVRKCYVTSSVNYLGGQMKFWSSTWSTINTGAVLGSGEISGITFMPMAEQAFGIRDPAMRIISQPSLNISDCFLAWGLYGSGPISFIALEGQCQGVSLTRCNALGVKFGIVIQAAPDMANSITPTYIKMTDCGIDSFSGIAFFINGTAAQLARDITIDSCSATEAQSFCTAATVAAGGSGYFVGDILSGPSNHWTLQEGQAVLLQVTTIGAGGAVTGVSIPNAGHAQTWDANPIAFTGGHGTGARFNLTYSGAGVGIWARQADRCNFHNNYMENYGINPSGGLNRVGFGIILEDIVNSQITKNRIFSFSNAIYCQNANTGNLIFSENILVDNLTADFGGFQPYFSIVQDNIGVPWLSGTPAMPVSGDFAVNTAPYSQQVFITGGVMFGIAIRFGGPPGIGIQPAIGGQWNEPIILTLRPNHSIAVSYSTAPTWTWIPML